MLRRLIRSSSSRLRGLRDALRIVRPGGLRFLRRWEHSLHAVVDGFDQRAADSGLATIKRIAKRNGGHVLPPTLSISLRIDPFRSVEQLIIGPNGECSVPSHCNVPLSKAHELESALDAFFKDNDSFMQEHGLVTTKLYILQKSMLGVEPVIYWRDKLSPLRLSVASPERREMLSKIPANIASREAATDLRYRMVEMFRDFGGSHHQIGKFYPYRQTIRSKDIWNVLEEVKGILDPPHLMNPGALGLY